MERGDFCGAGGTVGDTGFVDGKGTVVSVSGVHKPIFFLVVMGLRVVVKCFEEAFYGEVSEWLGLSVFVAGEES